MVFIGIYSSFVRDYCPEKGVFDGRVLPQNLNLVHLHHPLSYLGITPMILSQEAAPLMLSRMGEDSLNGTPFFSYFMTFTHFRYMYSL